MVRKLEKILKIDLGIFNVIEVNKKRILSWLPWHNDIWSIYLFQKDAWKQKLRMSYTLVLKKPSSITSA